MKPINAKIICAVMLVALNMSAQAQLALHYKADIDAYASTYGEYAPYMMASNTHGVLTQARGSQLRLAAFVPMDSARRFSYGFGGDVVFGVNSGTQYDYCEPQSRTLRSRTLHQSPAFIQQLYGEVKYRSLFLTLGMKEQNSLIVDHELSSGDLCFSGNTRPVPGVRVGLIDFQNIPFTNGWAQIEAVYTLGKCMDSAWAEKQFNYNGHLCTDTYFSYKRCYLRSKPTQPFSVTVGLQAAMQAGGVSRYFISGVPDGVIDNKFTFKKLLQTFFPTNGSVPGAQYKEGNTVGSWDILGTYRLPSGAEIKAYYESLWEDGSGIGKLNGFDGLYGIQFVDPRPGYLETAVLEYFDFRNQSGPIHWAPGDFGDMQQPHWPGHATGRDDYYNNYLYSGYQYYGMCIGSPLFKSALYNLNGSNMFMHNRICGFHLAIKGHLMPALQYRAMVSYRSSLGTYDNPDKNRPEDMSAMIELKYGIVKVKGLQLRLQLAADRGELYGDNFGAMLGVSYTGNLGLDFNKILK